MNVLLVYSTQDVDSNMGNTNPKLRMGKLNKCTNSPSEPFGPFIKYLFKWKDGSFGLQANIKKYFTALIQAGDLFVFYEYVGIHY